MLGFNLKNVLEGKAAGHKWEALAEMKEARANFLLAVVDNKVYVYGGIKGTSNEADQTHHPLLNEVLCEVYDPVENTWSEENIEGGCQLAAFGYTQLQNSHEVLIMGGTDGSLFSQETYILDLAAKKLTMQGEVECEHSVSMNKLFYRKQDNTVYSLGGLGSYGRNLKLTLGGKSWEEFSRKHTDLNLADQDWRDEIANYPFMYFD